jgi:hypothetical protein
MKITTIRYYGGARDKVCRLALADLFLELQQILLDTRIELVEQPEANSAAVIRERLDQGFDKASNWVKTTAGGIDWIKRLRYNQTLAVKMGVEIQVSARSDLLIRDIVHLRNSLQQGEIDIGVIVVPSDRLQTFLPDRTPSLKDALRYIEQEFKEATTFPIVVIAVEHDAAGKALPKKKTNKGKASG